MPKIAPYTLTWLPEQASYELYETRKREPLSIVPDSSTWFVWLESVSSFAFTGKHSHYTARKEARARGERYWYAYQTQGKRIKKKYLGKTSDMTLPRLESIAARFSTQSKSEADDRPLLSGSLPIATGVQADGDALSQLKYAAPHSPLQPLLMTRLHLPRPRPQLVARTHLVERLQQGVRFPLTLISAPAGFGKTTLLAQWLQESRMPVAWLSLEPEDNDPACFLPSMIAALQTLDARSGTTALALLHTPKPPSPEMLLALLVKDVLEHESRDIVLVLDDYHVITSEPLQQGMGFLLKHLPPQLHLVLSTRIDPSLPLSRLRVQGMLAEIRAADLRFTTDEVHSFLQKVIGLELSSDVMAALEHRTEGWIAGLQLAALSLQGKTDIAGFVAGFTGTHRFVLDYLSEEVLMRQPPSVQTFLLRTSLLERLSGPLCDVVTAQQGSQEMLERLEKANLFVVPLDETRGWYRYHHLFAEALRRHLHQREPALIPQLHRRASKWYEQHDLPLEAIAHALAIPDEEQVIRLIEPVVIPYAFRGQRSLVLRWLNGLPSAVIHSHPLLCVYYASLLLLTNQYEAAEIRIREAEAGFEQGMSAKQVHQLQGFIYTNRSTIAFFSGDLAQAVPFAQQALDLLPETEDFARPGVLANVSSAYQLTGDVTPETERAVTEALTLIRTRNNPFATVSCMALLARLHVLQGRLRDAVAIYAQIMQDVSSPEMLQATFSGPYYYFGMGERLHEWNDLEEAERYLQQGMELLHDEVPIEAWVAIQGYTAFAWLQQARGNAKAARSTLDALAQFARQRHFVAPMQVQCAALRAQLDLIQGNLISAVHWMETCRYTLDDTNLLYPHEYAYLTLARVHIAQKMQASTTFSLQQVLHLLKRLLAEAESNGRQGSILEILKVRVLALAAQGDLGTALTTLEQLILLAEPEGYIRFFVDEGPVMQMLLRRMRCGGIHLEYVKTILNAFGESHQTQAPLIEPLTRREREILGLLLEGASNHEIAQRLVLSVNTVKRHVYNLCSKLGVQSRMQAITRARSLNLL